MLNNTAINRLVTQFEPEACSFPQSFAEFLSMPNIILLGDPGMGKTYMFKASAEHEHAKYMTVRTFIALEGRGCEGQILYLDALDEFRSRTDAGNLIIDLIQILNKNKLKSFRLSCRSADWFSDDLELFRGYFNDENFAVLGLHNLTQEEIITVLNEKKIPNPDNFITDANNRGLEGLLSNPQTLLMLAELVRDNEWPRTRTELYQKSIDKLLSEEAVPHTRGGLGVFTASELEQAAGAVCCAVLISNVAGISLLNTTSLDYPSYRDLIIDDIDKISASLTRRAFQLVDQASESFTYVHRTVAEFLAAKWVVSQVSTGYPLRRFQSLIGVDRVPSSELRGLNAWVATLLPKNGTTFIKADPHGIALYGDAANLNLEDRSYLLECLQDLSERDPWFRQSTNWASESLGALAGEDIVDRFKEILADKNSTFHLKGLVLTSIINGPDLPAFLPIAENLLADNNASYSERVSALRILQKFGNTGNKIIITTYKNILSKDLSTVRLRIEILGSIYSDNFSVDDLCNDMKDYISEGDRRTSMELWGLENAIPEDEIASILNRFVEHFSKESEECGYRSTLYEFSRFVLKLIDKLLGSEEEINPQSLYLWLAFSFQLETHQGRENSSNSLERWLSAKTDRRFQLYAVAVNTFKADEHWRWFTDFHGATFSLYSTEEIIEYSFEVLPLNGPISDTYKNLYGLVGEQIFHLKSHRPDYFEKWIHFTLSCEDYSETYKSQISCPLSTWRVKSIERKIKHDKEVSKKKEKELAIFNETKDLMRSGAHNHNLSVLSRHYFDELTVDIDPIRSIKDRAGVDIAPLVLEGFVNYLLADKGPKPFDVGARNGTYYHSWYIILAGMDELYRRGSDFSELPVPIVKSALAISFAISIFIRSDKRSRSQITLKWVEKLRLSRLDLYLECAEEITHGSLSIKSEYNDGIYVLVNKDLPEDRVLPSILGLLDSFPSMHHRHLGQLVGWVLASPNGGYTKLSEIAEKTLQARGKVKGRQRAIWMVAAYLIAPDHSKSRLSKFMTTRPWITWIIIDLIQPEYRTDSDFSLSMEQLEFFALQIAKHFQDCDHPTSGWSGNNNPWDAAQAVKGLVHRLSLIESRQAIGPIDRLIASPHMSSYLKSLAHSKQNLLRVIRDSEYVQPNWNATLQALSNKGPVNAADLHALLIDHLVSLQTEIRHGTTSPFRRFWRHGAGGVLVEPDVEDHCRDRLIELMREKVGSLGVRLEPEGHMADDKRADIVAYLESGKIPLELKRDFHSEVWSACQNQLDRLYTRDPEALGYGVYIVFWFGDHRGYSMPSPPTDVKKPRSADDLETALNGLICKEDRHRLATLVIDVSTDKVST